MNWAKGEIGCMTMHYWHHELTSVSRDPLVLWYGIHLGVVRAYCMPCWFGNQSPLEWLTGKTPNISEFMDFDFYKFVIWYDPNDPNKGSQTCQKLGRWLGPAKAQGQALVMLLYSEGQWHMVSMINHATCDNRRLCQVS